MSLMSFVWPLYTEPCCCVYCSVFTKRWMYLLIEEDINTNNEALCLCSLLCIILSFVGFFFRFITQTYYVFMIYTMKLVFFSSRFPKLLSYCVLWSCRVFLYDRQVEIELHIPIKQAATEDTQVIYLLVTCRIVGYIVRGETGHAWIHTWQSEAE